MTTFTVTITPNPGAVNLRYTGDIIPAAKPKPETAVKPKPAAKPKPARMRKYPTTKPEQIPVISVINACGRITVRAQVVRCFITGERVFYSVTDIARAFGKRPDHYKFAPGFLAYARTPHSERQFLKWVEMQGVLQYPEDHPDDRAIWAVWHASNTYKQM